MIKILKIDCPKESDKSSAERTLKVRIIYLQKTCEYWKDRNKREYEFFKDALDHCMQELQKNK